MTYSEQIAANVRAEVARAGLTQKAVAGLLGLSTASTSDRFNNRTRFDPDELMLLANHLGIDVEIFYKVRARQAQPA